MELDRNDCRTVQELRAMAKREGWKLTNWRGIARRLASDLGKVMVWRADDTMVEYRAEAGKVRQRTIKPNAWRFNAAWHANPR